MQESAQNKGSIKLKAIVGYTANCFSPSLCRQWTSSGSLSTVGRPVPHHSTRRDENVAWGYKMFCTILGASKSQTYKRAENHQGKTKHSWTESKATCIINIPFSEFKFITCRRDWVKSHDCSTSGVIQCCYTAESCKNLIQVIIIGPDLCLMECKSGRYFEKSAILRSFCCQWISEHTDVTVLTKLLN